VFHDIVYNTPARHAGANEEDSAVAFQQFCDDAAPALDSIRDKVSVVCVCVYVYVCVCVLSHWAHAAIVEVPDLPSLKCSSHWFLGLYPASVLLLFVVLLLAHAPKLSRYDMQASVRNRILPRLTHTPTHMSLSPRLIHRSARTSWATTTRRSKSGCDTSAQAGSTRHASKCRD